jgi:Phage integrase, N-terminal SAM-like domain
MTTAAPSTALAAIQPAFTDAERLALAGFLAGYRGLTREAYTLDLRQFTTWCRARSLNLFAVRRADIESFARDLEALGRARATVTRRLCTIAGFYKYAAEEELLEHSPAAHVRRPRVDYESRAVALDRNELGALLVAAGLGPPPEHALISLLALNGLRVSEATGADIEHLGLERGPPDADDHPQDTPGLNLSNRAHLGLFAMALCQGVLTLPDGQVPHGPAVRGGRRLPSGHAASVAPGIPARWDHATASSYSRPVFRHPCRMPVSRLARRRIASSWPMSCARSSS